jgi:hypothetical protein
MLRYTFQIDEVVIFNHTYCNITVTLSALFSSIKDVTRNLGGFFTPKKNQSKKQKASTCL